MITGTHALIHSDHAEEIRAFFRDILKFPSVDAGHAWLIFSLPPAEIGMHPAEKGSHYELYLLCDDINSTVADLEKRGVKFSSPITDARFGFVTSLRFPVTPNSAFSSPCTRSPRPGSQRKRVEPASRTAPKRNHAQTEANSPQTRSNFGLLPSTTPRAYHRPAPNQHPARRNYAPAE